MRTAVVISGAILGVFVFFFIFPILLKITSWWGAILRAW